MSWPARITVGTGMYTHGDTYHRSAVDRMEYGPFHPHSDSVWNMSEDEALHLARTSICWEEVVAIERNTWSTNESTAANLRWPWFHAQRSQPRPDGVLW